MAKAHTAFLAWREGNYHRTNAATLVGSPGQGRRDYNGCGSTKFDDKWYFRDEAKKHSLFVDDFVAGVVKLTKQPSQNRLTPKDWHDTEGGQDLAAAPPLKFRGHSLPTDVQTARIASDLS